MELLKTLSLIIAKLALTSTILPADTLDSVKEKGVLTCGVSTGIAGFLLLIQMADGIV